MKKIAICCQHSYPHVGGVETIVKLLSEFLFNEYSVDVDVYSCSNTQDFSYNNINYYKINTNFIDTLKNNRYNSIFIYGDCFKYLIDIVIHGNEIPGKKVISLVGANQLYKDNRLLKLILDRKDKLHFVVHDYIDQDYDLCVKLNLPVSIIANGVNLHEFDSCNTIFKNKYSIRDNEKIILCVANFFPGKGQEHFVKIINSVKDSFDNMLCKLVLISSSVNFKYVEFLSSKCEQQLKSNNISHLFLKDIGREDTIAAFNAADAFVTPSVKEVAPVCLLEAMASKTPWVAWPVGNVKSLKGGIVVPCMNKDAEGYLAPTDTELRNFGKSIVDLIDNKDLYDKCLIDGYNVVNQRYNWSNIIKQYYKLFFD